MIPRTKIKILSLDLSPEIDNQGAGDLTALASDGRLVIQGWMVTDGTPATQVEVALGGEIVARAPINRRRPDVAEALGVEQAANCGFRVALWSDQPVVAELLVQAVLADGTLVPLGSVEAEVIAPERGLLSKLRRRRSRSPAPVAWSSDAPIESQKILVGRDDWLFLRNDTNDVQGQHTGRVSLGPTVESEWADLFDRRSKVVADEGALWLCAIAPDKESVYPEYLPPETLPSDSRPVHRLLEIARETDASVVYLLDALQGAKDVGELYPRTDTHWAYRGAYVGYVAICQELRRRGVKLPILNESRIDWQPEIFHGDLGSKAYPSAQLSTRWLPHMETVQATLVYDNGVPNHGHVKIFERDDETAPRAVVFGESFADSLLLFMRESFSRVCFVHTSMLVREVIAEEKPDVVLSVPVERFMVRAPSDREAWQRLSGEATEKGGELPWTLAKPELKLANE
jgi:hypothetical protein